MIPLVFFVYNIYAPCHWKNTRIANTFNKWKLFFVDSIHLGKKIMLAFLLTGNTHKSIWTDMDTITNIESYFIMTSNQVLRIIAIITFGEQDLCFTFAFSAPMPSFHHNCYTRLTGGNNTWTRFMFYVLTVTFSAPMA